MLARGFATAAKAASKGKMAAAAVGTKISPDLVLHDGSPGNQVKAGDVFKGKVVVLGVPGAFTPGCSKTHLPGYVAAADAIKAKGVSQIVCVSVNDAFVMKAWEEAQGATGKVRCLADPQAAFVKSLGLDVDLAVLGGVRSKRFSAIVEDGVIKALNVEPDNTGLTCSLADPIMKQL